MARAERLLSFGESVVVDASWTARQWRDAAVAVAGRTHADLFALRCMASPDVTAERLRSRNGISDADETIAAAMRADTAPWPEALAADTTIAVEETVRQAIVHIRPHPAARPWLPRRPVLEPD